MLETDLDTIANTRIQSPAPKEEDNNKHRKSLEEYVENEELKTEEKYKF